ncbi:MAG: OmpA family protein [Candidatus Krumholzibacteriota bacterium]|nr:OmpA family protein [Candidatus Krumholzibacteriota bacterium]
MPDPVSKEASVGKVEKETESTTHGKTTTTVKKIKVSILEMEDVLFHYNSAVMMPESPVEEPEDDKGSEKQEKVTGARAMALIFKQYDFDPDKKLLIAGHTDTSGDDKSNFELSELRAQNVQYILTAQRDLWAEISYSRQKIEDYQQILNYVNKTYKYPCNCGKIDNKWGDITKGATETFIRYFNGEFITRYGKDFTGPMTLKKIPGGQPELVKKDGKKRWTEELWRAAYNFYFLAIAKPLDITPSALYEKATAVIKWADEKNKYVACGESFPIDQAKKDDYRSQDNRRVEILVFDSNDSPVIKCPETDDGKPKWDAKHKPEECPLWHDLILRPLYLDPRDMNSIVYHIAFTYWDKVKAKVMRIPEGLPVEAYQDGKKVESVISYNQSEKVYCVKVRYKKPIKDLAGIKLHFEFKAKDKWLYTKNKDSDPVIFPGKDEDKDLKELQKTDLYKDVKKIEDIGRLRLPGSLNFYDLPAEWSSVNYWARYEDGGGKKTGGRFQKVIADADKLHLKPVGKKLTKPKKPITFSLDDIVLVDAKGKQEIKDKDDNDALKALSDKSHYSLFYVKNENLELYNPLDAKAPYFTKHDFKQNLITDLPADGPARLIAFANDFYSISNQRAGQKAGTFDPAKDQVKGCRAASIKDPDNHVAQKVKYHQYSAGTLTLVAGSPSVTGAGTSFLDNVLEGDTILVNSLNVYRVKSVESNTELTLTGNAVIAEAGTSYLAKTPGANYIDYRVGTVTLANGSAQVTGTGTAFNGNVYAGAILKTAGGKIYFVKSVKSDTVLELTGNASASEANVNYIAKSCHYLYCAAGVGNYELHYVHDGCLISKTDKLKGLKVRSFLVIYWNGVFEGKTYPHNAPDKNVELLKSPPAAPNTPFPITNAEVKNYETIGLMNAKKRWESKPYTIEPVKSPDDGGKCAVQITPVFFFEAKKEKLGGKPKCKVEISNDKSAGSMGVTKSWMYHPDYKIRDYLKVGEFKDIDSRRYETLVVAHELSHGEGKDDEYAYITNEIASGSRNSLDHRFSQYYFGMPYSADVGSMMKDNRAPRIKQVWPFVNWINDATGEGGKLKEILGETQFKVAHRFSLGGTQKEFNYYLKNDSTAVPPVDYRDICKPYKETGLISAGNPGTGKIGLGLYKLGEDEGALRKIKIGGANKHVTFDGVVSIFIKLGFKWDFSGGNWNDPYDPTKPKSAKKWKYWFDQLVQEYKNLNSRPFYLENTTDANHDFKRILVYLFPVYRDEGTDGWPVPGAHYDLTLTLNNSAAASTKAGKTLSVGDKFPFRHIVNYTLGKDSNAALVPNDLNFVRDWIRSNSALNNNHFNTKRAEA